MTVSPNKDVPDKVDITGRAAHITAAQDGGPRFNIRLTAEQRKAATNGIWLCSDCADLIDKNEGDGFSLEQLQSWKRAAEERQLAIARLRSRLRRPTWLDNLATPHYVNVPRLLHLAGGDALSHFTMNSLTNGFPRRQEIIRQLVEIDNVIRHMTIEAIDVREISKPADQLFEGLIISYHQRCRTKNGNSTDPDDVTNYSFDKSPLIYLDCNGCRYIQPYDPIWITTNTAQGTVRSGNSILAGIAIIKSLDAEAKQAIASPIAFGIPNMFGF